MATFNFSEYTGSDDLKKIKSYLFMLNEQLRYMFSNMDPEDNFSEESFQKYLQNGKRIAFLEMTSDNLMVHLENADKDIAELRVRADSITAEVKNNRGDISILQQTATALTSKITDAQGNISVLQQTASTLTSEIADAKGNISSLQQTATSLTSEIKDAKGHISSLQQTATSLTSEIKAANGNISSLEQTANKIDWIVKSGSSSTNFTLTSRMASLVSDQIDLTGYVTISSLKSAGKTTINGSNITTGELDAMLLRIDGETVFEKKNGTVKLKTHFGLFGDNGLTFDYGSYIKDTGILVIHGKNGVSLDTYFGKSSISINSTLSDVISAVNSIITWINKVD